jgi:hypothetical protein
MNLAQEAFQELYPHKQESREFSIKYTRAFKGYNANVRYSASFINFRLSYLWKEVSTDIKKGLIQTLLVRMYKDTQRTMEMELYHSFLKNLSNFAAVNKTDPILEASFERVNKQYFNDMLDKPNLIMGNESFSKLGHFEYSTNTIVISSILLEDPLLLDYVMYHEMLHKKLKFHSSGSKTYHHTKTFKDLEAKFDDGTTEEKLHDFLRRKKRKKWLWF